MDAQRVWQTFRQALPQDAEWLSKTVLLQGRHFPQETPAHVSRVHSIEETQRYMLMPTAYFRPEYNPVEAYLADSIMDYVATVRAWSRINNDIFVIPGGLRSYIALA